MLQLRGCWGWSDDQTFFGFFLGTQAVHEELEADSRMGWRDFGGINSRFWDSGDSRSDRLHTVRIDVAHVVGGRSADCLQARRHFGKC